MALNDWHAFQVRLPPPLVKKAKELVTELQAADPQRGWSLNQLITEALRYYLAVVNERKKQRRIRKDVSST